MTDVFRRGVLAFVMIFSFGGMLAVAQPTPVAAACDNRLLTFPAWYKGLQKSDCSLKDVTDQAPANGNRTQVPLRLFIIILALNVSEMILQLVGYAAVVMIIVGGYKYLISTGDPNQMTGAKKTIMNAVIGLVISLFSVAIVNIVTRSF